MHVSDRHPAVFLDRDHTLIEDPGYLNDPAQVRLLPGVAEAVRQLRAAGYLVVVATNQSGLARGLITDDQLAAVHARLRELLKAERADLDAIYHCPFLPGEAAVVEKYRGDSELRKPRPGMLLLAAKEMNIDLARSWMIGDSPRDVEAGRSAGCRTILIAEGHSPPDGASCDHVATDLPHAAQYILSQHGGA